MTTPAPAYPVTRNAILLAAGLVALNATLQLFVAKEPREQGGGSFARLTVRLEANTLSLTPIANSRGRIVAGVTSKYVRVE